MRQGVVPVSPSGLFLYLQTIAYGLKGFALSRNLEQQVTGIAKMQRELAGLEKLIDTGGNRDHRAGFWQQFQFDGPTESVHLSAMASLYTHGGLMLRIGIDPTSNTDPYADTVKWSGWYGPDNGWSGDRPATLVYTLNNANTDRVTVFLESRGKWRLKNTSRWRDVQIHATLDDEPEPEPEPDDGGIPGQIAALQAEINELAEQIEGRLERIDALLDEWDRMQRIAQALNDSRGV